jgi:hypothetical protein
MSVAIDQAGTPVGVLQREARSRFDNGVGGCMTQSTTYDVSLVLRLAGAMTPVGGAPAVTSTSFSDLGFPIVAPQAAISPSGIVLAWGDATDSTRGQPKVRFYAPDGSGASAPQTVGSTPSFGSVSPSLGVAADGRALLAWSQLDRFGGDVVVTAAERPPGGAFGEPAPVSRAGEAFNPAVRMADGGDGMVVWFQSRTAPYAIHVRGYDASAPQLSGVAIPSTASAGVPAAFAAVSFDVWGPVTLAWDFGDGGTGTGAAPQNTYAAAGRYAVSVTATDAAGNNSAAKTATVQVSAPPAPPSPSPSPPAASGPLVLSGVSLTPRAFRVGRGPTALSARRRSGGRGRPRAPPVGTTFRFTLNRAATVSIAFAREASGKRSGRRCVRPSRRLASARRCTRLVAAGRLLRAGRADANAVAFSGRLGRSALRPGSYRATLTATAGGMTRASSALSFRVVR